MKFVIGYGWKQISKPNYMLKTVASYNVSSVVLMCQYARPLGHTLISDLVVSNLFMHSLPGTILLCLATPFYTEGVFAWDIITVRFIHIGVELLIHI